MCIWTMCSKNSTIFLHWMLSDCECVSVSLFKNHSRSELFFFSFSTVLFKADSYSYFCSSFESQITRIQYSKPSESSCCQVNRSNSAMCACVSLLFLCYVPRTSYDREKEEWKNNTRSQYDISDCVLFKRNKTNHIFG